MTRAPLWLSAVALVAGAGLLAAAGLAGPTQSKGGTLRLSSPRDVDSLDPALGYLTSTWALEFATCAKLYNYSDQAAPKGAIVIPEVASGFPRVSTDGKTQTIELKRRFRFHDGQRVTAANFVAAFNRNANPIMNFPATQFLHEFVGADAVIAGKAQTISGVVALGPYTLQIRTTRPLADLTSRLTMPFFCPIATSTPLQEISNPLGSGPYYIASHVPNRQIVLERNGFYRGSRPANVDRVVLSIGLGQGACRDAVERNETDYCISGVPPADYADIAAKYGINRRGGQFFFNPTLGTNYFAFNHDRPAFKGPGQIALKQAINWAIDRPELVRAAGYLGGKRTDQILPPALGRDTSIYPLRGVSTTALARARALLDKAKIRPRHLVLWAPSFAPPNAWAQTFQFNLKRLGIDVDVRYFQSYGAMAPSASIRGAPFDVVLFGWIADYADPISFFGTLNGNLRRADNSNVAYFNRPKYNRAIARVGRLSGEAQRKAWADLDAEMMREDPPWAPFMSPAARHFISRSFGCYVFHPVFGLDIAAACKR